MTERKSKAGATVAAGGVVIALGIGLALWARSHSPHMGFMEMMGKTDSYMLKEPVYYAVMIIAGLLGLVGVVNVVKGLGGRGKNAISIAKSLTGEVSGLDKIKQAKELLDAGAIDAAEFDKIKKEALER